MNFFEYTWTCGTPHLFRCKHLCKEDNFQELASLMGSDSETFESFRKL